jgi:hypothetical protein
LTRTPYLQWNLGARPAARHRGSGGSRRYTEFEFLMGDYGIPDRARKGRDEGDAFQVWLRRHDEYCRA